jgi:hypothetical protein
VGFLHPADYATCPQFKWGTTIAMWSPDPLRQVLCGWVKILRINSKFSGRFSKGFAVSFRRLKNK